jgi:hypothetical protein
MCMRLCASNQSTTFTTQVAGGQHPRATTHPPTHHPGAAFQNLPPPVKEAVVDMGIAHYLVLVRDADGVIRQWDFGPCGGDVHIDLPGSSFRPRARPIRGRAAAMETLPLDGASGEAGASSPEGRGVAGEAGASSSEGRGVAGEVREHVLLSLPTHAPLVHIGKTSLSPAQIRDFSVRQPMHYLLHENDCRHYTNNLVQLLTGQERSTAHFLRKQVRADWIGLDWIYRGAGRQPWGC